MNEIREDSVNDASLDSDEQRLVVGIRQQLDRSCNALDGHTLSRLNRIRHAALERKQTRSSRMLLPFGGFVTACVLVLSVTLFRPGSAPDADLPAGTAPLEDIEILTSSDSLDLYEDYEFYQWLAENDSPV
jgi:hypothetical protein